MHANEVILSCPGGKCPIKISCVTHLRKDATTTMNVPPFSQTGIVIRCTYFKLKEYATQPKTDTPPNTVEEKVLPDIKIEQQESRPVEAVAVDQGQLFGGVSDL